MDVFTCARCEAVLTSPLSRIAFPDYTFRAYGHDLHPVFMPPGTYAIAEEPMDGIVQPGAVLLGPGDTCGTVLIPDRCDGYCMGLTGWYGPNMACAQCAQPVATRVDDCSYWQAVWFEPDTVRRSPVEGTTRWSFGWDELARAWHSSPALEPVGHWNPRWHTPMGAALAHLLVASEGAPVAVPDGLIADTLGHALDLLLPPGPRVRKLALAGPGLADPVTDIVLVPRHPLSGEVWQPSNAAVAVPVAAEIWLHLAFDEELPVPKSGGMPGGVFRDYPLPNYPYIRFRPNLDAFLARLSAFDEPWIREIHDRFKERPYQAPF